MPFDENTGERHQVRFVTHRTDVFTLEQGTSDSLGPNSVRATWVTSQETRERQDPKTLDRAVTGWGAIEARALRDALNAADLGDGENNAS